MIVDFGDLRLPRLCALLLDASTTRAHESQAMYKLGMFGECNRARLDAELLYQACLAITTTIRAVQPSAESPAQIAAEGPSGLTVPTDSEGPE